MDFSTKHCRICGQNSAHISQVIGVCADCIRSNFEQVRPHLESVHASTRAEFGLPPAPPRHSDGVQCELCGNQCQIEEGGLGYCGLRTVENGRLVHLSGTPQRGMLHWYRDPLPTNCVADWVCEGCNHPGNHNLAVFYGSCTANCLFCQNWHYRDFKPNHAENISAQELASFANADTFCVCFFGGDPASQITHSLAAAKLFADQGVRVCWETNGTAHPKLLRAAVRYAFDTGGCFKFDLKAFDEEIHYALTGVSNQRTLENFAHAARRHANRPDNPLILASTLLVPGYVDAQQVSKIAQMIASINPDIPYALLGFAPNFYLSDLPCTSIQQAEEAQNAALDAGLTNVRIGNRHLLGLLCI